MAAPRAAIDGASRRSVALRGCGARRELGEGRWDDARALFDRVALSPRSSTEFLTLPAYDAHRLKERTMRAWTRSARANSSRPLTRHRATYRRGRRRCAARSRVEHTLAATGRRAALGAPARGAVRRRARRADRRPGRADGEGRPEGDLPLRLAGRGRREPRRPDLPRPEPLPGEQRARAGASGSTRRSCAPTRSSTPRATARTATGSRRSWPTPRPASAAPLNAFELMRAMIEAGAAGVHFEDQLASEKKCGHMGGKVLVPTSQFIRTLVGRAPRGRRLRRADGARRPHRRAQRRRCSRATSTSATTRSSPASARPRASSASRAASSPPSRAAWPTRRTPT